MSKDIHISNIILIVWNMRNSTILRIWWSLVDAENVPSLQVFTRNSHYVYITAGYRPFFGRMFPGTWPLKKMSKAQTTLHQTFERAGLCSQQIDWLRKNEYLDYRRMYSFLHGWWISSRLDLWERWLGGSSVWRVSDDWCTVQCKISHKVGIEIVTLKNDSHQWKNSVDFIWNV